MEYCLSTKERVLVLEPEHSWDGDPEFELQILGRSDSDYAKDPGTRKGVRGTSTLWCPHHSAEYNAEKCGLVSHRS